MPFPSGGTSGLTPNPRPAMIPADDYDHLHSQVSEMVGEGYSDQAIIAALGDDADPEILAELITEERGL